MPSAGRRRPASSGCSARRTRFPRRAARALAPTTVRSSPSASGCCGCSGSGSQGGGLRARARRRSRLARLLTGRLRARGRRSLLRCVRFCRWRRRSRSSGRERRRRETRRGATRPSGASRFPAPSLRPAAARCTRRSCRRCTVPPRPTSSRSQPMRATSKNLRPRRAPPTRGRSLAPAAGSASPQRTGTRRASRRAKCLRSPTPWRAGRCAHTGRWSSGPECRCQHSTCTACRSAEPATPTGCRENSRYGSTANMIYVYIKSAETGERARNTQTGGSRALARRALC
mmetsp:Transcript_37750/g.121766  ORF Transcript_37750/g.121766 Transcript_37750/m.121766 type:complete len:286 (-) Transcript_37750:29-886(-)